MKSRYRRDGARAWHAGDAADVDSDDNGSGLLREGRMRGGYSPVSSYDSRSWSLLFASPFCPRSTAEQYLIWNDDCDITQFPHYVRTGEGEGVAPKQTIVLIGCVSVSVKREGFQYPKYFAKIIYGWCK